MITSIPDIIILIIIIVSSIWGMYKGLISQIVSIISLIVGSWCAFKFSGYLTLQIKELFSISTNTSIIQAFIFILIFIGIIILGKFLAKGLEAIIKISMLGWLNKLLGFIFAFIKTIIILGLIAYTIKYLNDSFQLIPSQYLESSRCYTALIGFTNKIFPYMHTLIK